MIQKVERVGQRQAVCVRRPPVSDESIVLDQGSAGRRRHDQRTSERRNVDEREKLSEPRLVPVVADRDPEPNLMPRDHDASSNDQVRMHDGRHEVASPERSRVCVAQHRPLVRHDLAVWRYGARARSESEWLVVVDTLGHALAAIDLAEAEGITDRDGHRRARSRGGREVDVGADDVGDASHRLERKGKRSDLPRDVDADAILGSDGVKGAGEGDDWFCERRAEHVGNARLEFHSGVEARL
eukprot:1102614-Rhodomonas_salina.6